MDQASGPIFVADAMLGSLARKLRIYGCDTLYPSNLDDSSLLTLSLKEGRVLLTSDKALYEYSLRHGAPSILLPEGGDDERLAHVFKALQIDQTSLDPNRSRCPRCNGDLSPSSRRELAGVVPESILSRHIKFYRCFSCGRIYWKGSHWKRITLFSRRVGRLLNKANRSKGRKAKGFDKGDSQWR